MSTQELQQIINTDFKKSSNEERKEVRNRLKNINLSGLDFKLTKKDGLKFYLKFKKEIPFGLQLGILNILPHLPKNGKGYKIIEVPTENGIAYIEITEESGTHVYSKTDILDFKSFSDALLYVYKQFSV